MKKAIKTALAAYGYAIVPVGSVRPDVPPDLSPHQEVFTSVRPYTMTSIERISALVEAVRYVVSANIEGAIVECGVWRGGSMMAIAKTLVASGETGKNLFLFDTFEGMPDAGQEDVNFRGQSASNLLEHAKVRTREERLQSFLFAWSPLEIVQTNMANTGYPSDKIHFVKGKVEDTLPAKAPEKISILRLDTDWYESTRHELIHLFPRLSRGGVLIIDDYGHWQGARKAVDEYFEDSGIKLLLSRIDYTARMAVKP